MYPEENKTPPPKSSGSGRLFILSAPSGGGKSTLCQALLNRFEDLRYSISYTTRNPRSGEKDGEDYFFISRDEFTRGIAENRWAEWAKVHDNFYGTSAQWLNAELATGHDILLDIDVQGARQIFSMYPKSITIFVMPPSIEVLRKRLESRGADTREVIEKRLKNAEKEIAQKDFYRHAINTLATGVLHLDKDVVLALVFTRR